MLVLSRKVGERILIGDQVAVTIVRVSGGGVRVGIEAPTEMAVLRAEILDEQDKKSTVEMFQGSTAKESLNGSQQADTSTSDKSASLPSLEEKPLRKAR